MKLPKFLLLLVFLFFCVCESADDIVRISDNKELKKLFKSRTNVLIMYTNEVDPVIISEYAVAASKVKGKGTLALVNCKENKATKKLCDGNLDSKQKVSVKHYKEGEFNKDFNRPFKAKSFERFILDPNTEAPWEEDPIAQDVVHVDDSSLDKTIARNLPTLVMFYAPWCGHCKRIKPEYAVAATELKGKAILAAIDTTAANSRGSGMRYNITGYPTIKYFENGEFKFEYGFERNKKGILDFIAQPGPPPPPPPPEPEWSTVESRVNHLGEENFTTFLAEHPSTLIMFYAPWCGHCKAAKPEYQSAADVLHQENIPGALAAVDATKNSALGSQFEVTGYPTFLYFKNGQKAFAYTLGRKKDDFVNFLKDPKEPPPPPPPEPEWSETPSSVVHLTDNNFHSTLKNKKHALVMFYAPWCGHCKAFKPAFQEAAESLKDNKQVRLVGVDCTKNKKICEEYEITGYPTIKYFSHGKVKEDYPGTRTKDAVIEYLGSKSLKAEL